MHYLATDQKNKNFLLLCSQALSDFGPQKNCRFSHNSRKFVSYREAQLIEFRRAGTEYRRRMRGKLGGRTCQFCRFANPVVGLPRGILICVYPTADGKSCSATAPLGRCGNFNRADSAPLLPGRDHGTRLIPVKGGPFALVDARDYDKLVKYKWFAKYTPTTCYAVARVNNKYIFMHRLITGAPKGMAVDHIDHNGMNNTRKNLRLCTPRQNRYNSRPRKGGTSKYKGVFWNTQRRKFCARINHNRKSYHLGFFNDEKDAAKAYDKKAKQLHGKFAYLNFQTK